MTVDLEDLKYLSGNDLAAVFRRAGRQVVLAALWGIDRGVKDYIFRALPTEMSQELQQALQAMPTPALETVRLARRRLLNVLGELSRQGRIAFDLPEDLVA